MIDTIDRPYTTVILAISADGKIADAARSPARFGSANDKAHLEQQVADSDAVLFGNGTLQAYGTTMRVISPELLKQRELHGKPPQPAQIVCSRSSKFDPNLRFFQQPVPRWLLTAEGEDGERGRLGEREDLQLKLQVIRLFLLPPSFFLLPSSFFLRFSIALSMLKLPVERLIGLMGFNS
ncbi:RibD family protein [Microcoleus sp. S11D4]|uniref:RibD family protein n=1 Tax=Microcoleus sp. S11D4 TaxID=3055407 RepID=UPI002FD206A4